MNFRIVARFLSMLISMVTASMAFPLLWAFHEGLRDVEAFLFSMLIGFAASAALFLLAGKVSTEETGEREAVAAVAFSWVVASLVGCLPYILSGEIPSFTDAYFEAMSGFTTTGSSILENVEKLPRGILMWRAQTQWLGGMGIIVLLIALLPFFNTNLTQFFKAESPGPSLDKTTPRITEMAKNLWFVYMQLTLVGVILLCIGEVKFYDAIAYVFAAVATGGFSAHNNGVAFYNSAYVEYVLTIIMFIAGTNFNLHLAAIKTASMSPYKDSEFRFYSGIVGISIFMICLNLLQRGTYTNISDAFRYASFQVVSIITTTGFASTDYGEWSVFAQLLLLLLMFVGGCAGSTSGAIKCVRFQIVLKNVAADLKRLIYPNAIVTVFQSDVPVERKKITSSACFIAVYIIIWAISSLAVAACGNDIVTSISAVAASLNNFGPGLAEVGPTFNFSPQQVLAKWVYIFDMLCGRLELYTVLVLFTKDFWKR